jgi:hypothetical protein
MRTWFLRLLMAVGALASMPESLWAWGKEGHEVVGKVAEKFLSPEAKKAIDELLKEDQFRSIGDTRLTSWADFIKGSAAFKRKYKDNDKFHYIDIDVECDLDTFDLEKAAGEGENALKALRHFRKLLKDPATPLQERREALFFIVHILGDLQQPLHCAERTGDKGGNLCQVMLPGETTKINLHKVWDTSFVTLELGELTVADFTTKLLEEITPESKAEAQKGKLEDWILDSQRIARESIYKVVPKSAQTGETFKLNAEDVTAARAVVRKQLAKGGLRLAAYLNQTFKP